MKKSLLALAVLGAFAGAASAQTNVTVYGLVDVGVQYTKTKVDGVGSTSLTEMASGMQSGSRLGFKGSEDLGGGLSAIFTLENGFNADTGALAEGTALFNRQAWVGLKGNFGTVKFGRQYTPIHLAVDSVDPFSTGLAGDMSSNAFDTYGVRMSNTINYSLPNMGGFYGEVAYGLGEVADSTSTGRQIGLSAGYANGPLNAVFAYHNQNLTTGVAPAVVDDGEDKAYFFGATYDFKVVKAHAAYSQNKGEAADGTTDYKSRSYMVGVSAPVGAAGTVLASFQRADDRLSDDKFDVFALGYTHNLSKRTNLYTSYSHSKLVSFDTLGLPDVKANKFNVGVRHQF